jgi:hypothetical protein
MKQKIIGSIYLQCISVSLRRETKQHDPYLWTSKCGRKVCEHRSVRKIVQRLKYCARNGLVMKEKTPFSHQNVITTWGPIMRLGWVQQISSLSRRHFGEDKEYIHYKLLSYCDYQCSQCFRAKLFKSNFIGMAIKELVVAQLGKKLPIFYATRRLITVLTRDRLWSPS